MSDFFDQLEKGTITPTEEFKRKLDAALADNNELLTQEFFDKNGRQMTLMNRVIELSDDTTDYTPAIDYVRSKSPNINHGEPVHWAIKLGKITIAKHLLQPQEENKPLFDLDRRNPEGLSLLFLVIQAKLQELLALLIGQNINIHTHSYSAELKHDAQPLHQCIAANFGEGVRLLGKANAQLDNPVGPLKQTPLIQAAQGLKLDALEALLEFPVEKLKLEEENLNYYPSLSVGHTAVEELCEYLLAGKHTKDAVKGIAMLLCRGADLPRNDAMRLALSWHKAELLAAVKSYLEDKPELVDPFVKRCHTKDTPLHNMVYADHFWSESFKRFFGVADHAAWDVEDLLVAKYSNAKNLKDNEKPLSTEAFAKYSPDMEPSRLYAAFVRLYEQHYTSKLFANPWSGMRWRISKGQCDWDAVKEYAKSHPFSRTAQIYKDMFEPVAPVINDTTPVAEL